MFLAEVEVGVTLPHFRGTTECGDVTKRSSRLLVLRFRNADTFLLLHKASAAVALERSKRVTDRCLGQFVRLRF